VASHSAVPISLRSRARHRTGGPAARSPVNRHRATACPARRQARSLTVSAPVGSE
jgi:hypothetical protein